MIKANRYIRSRRRIPFNENRIVETKVIEGGKAVTRGRLIIAISILLIVLGLYGGLYFPYKLEKVFGEQIYQSAPQATSEN